MYITMINLIENMTLQSKSKLTQACKPVIKTKKLMFPIINYFDHEGPVVFFVLYDMTVGVFKHLRITY